jgi:hypothetical protein
MTFRVYATGGAFAPKTEEEFLARKPKLIARGAVDLDDALAFARDFIAAGQKVWEIERPDGTSIGRDEVFSLVTKQASALIGRPRVL